MAVNALAAAGLLSAVSRCAAGGPAPRIEDEDYLRPTDVVEKFLASGRSRSCELPSVDASKLSWEDFEDLAEQHGTGLVLKNLNWLNLEEWRKDRLLARFGDHLLTTGTGRWDRPEPTPERALRRFAAEAAQTRKSFVAKGYTHSLVSEAFWGKEGNCSEAIVASWLCDHSSSSSILADFDKSPTVQIGLSLASGTQLHSHEETWLALLHGMKAWWIAPSEPSEEVRREEQANTGHPCQWLEGTQGTRRPKGLAFCVQQPGEVIYFGSRLHATCNLADFVLGIGAQGRQPADWTPLERAMHRGQSARVKDLLKEKKKRLKPAQLDRWLAHASEYGFTSLVELLLDQRADLGGAKRAVPRFTPLHRAAENGHLAVAQLLLSRRADVHAKDQEAKEPLHHAAYNDAGEVAQLLLEHGASLRSQDQRSLAPFASAADGGYPDLMDMLLKRHAPTSARGYDPAALHAASKGHLPVLRRLLTHRADLAHVDPQGRRLADHAEFYQHHSVARFLRSLHQVEEL